MDGSNRKTRPAVLSGTNTQIVYRQNFGRVDGPLYAGEAGIAEIRGGGCAVFPIPAFAFFIFIGWFTVFLARNNLFRQF